MQTIITTMLSDKALTVGECFLLSIKKAILFYNHRHQ